jgi:hypothetical protein
MLPTLRGLGRRVRQTFGISAPRMAVRTRLSWRWRLPALLGLVALIAGMWWWGFDFGQFLGGFNRGAIAENQAKLETEAAALKGEINVTRGAQTTLSQQVLNLQSENTQMQEDLAFLRTLFSDSGKPGTVSIQHLKAEKDRDDVYRFSMLVVRGGNPSDEFSGRLTLLANVAAGGHSATLTLPDDQPDTATALTLKFKYYQRVEGTFRVPPGGQLRSLQVRVVEPGQSLPKATRNLNLM